VGILNTRF